LTRFRIPLPDGDLLTASFNRRITLSPDGSRIVCNPVRRGRDQLLDRSLDELDFKPTLENTGGVSVFSPNGRSLAYFESTGPYRLRKLALSGGAPTTLCDLESFAGATWADDDTIYLIPTVPAGIVRLAAETPGTPQEILKIAFDQGERLYKYPHALPGGKAVLYTLATVDAESFDDARIAVFSTQNGQRKTLVEGGTHPRFSPSRHLVYARNGSLLAVAFDPDRLEVIGQPFPVLEGVLMSRNTGVANFDISASGDLVYIPGTAVGGERTLHWVDRRGRSEALPLPPRAYLHPRLSPDGTRLAIEVEGTDHDVFVYDFRSAVLANLTTDGVSHWPIWSPDGRRIGYRSGPMGRFRLFEMLADRSAPARQVLTADFTQSPGSYSPDGHAMAFTMNLQSAATAKVAVVPLEGDPTPTPLDDSRYAQGSPKFSPDGRYLAYCSNESGRPQVYVKAFPGPGPKGQVSTDGGTDPVWRRDGRELFYRNGDSMMVVPVLKGPGFSTGRPEELWKAGYSHGMSSSCGGPGLTSSNYDVTADGQRFLMVRDDDVASESAREIVLVQGWADEVSRRAARS
jgi:hypothetical protein